MGVPSAFDASRYLTRVNNNDYLEVKWRLLWLRTEHPDADVQTELVSDTDFSNDQGKVVREAVFRCAITLPSGGSSSGYGSETSTDFRDYREKAETKAIGRACAVLGFGTQFAPEMGGEGVAGRPVDAPVQGPNNAPGIVPIQGGQPTDTARYASQEGNAPQRPQNHVTEVYGAGMGQHQAGVQPVSRAPQPIRQGQGNVAQVQAQQGQGHQPQIQDPDAPASPKQIQYVTDLLSGLGVDPNAFDWSGLTKGEASGYIATLRSGQLPQDVVDALNAAQG
jgi:hypothetical protein